jgi:SAM-dependent methyltransferase
MWMRHAEADRQALESLLAEPEARRRWRDLDELQVVATTLLGRLRAGRAARLELRPAGRLRERVDGALRSDRVEYLDRDDVPERVRAGVAGTLHRLNRVLASYRRFSDVLLEPARRAGRPLRFLELASGAGALAVVVARRAREEGLAVEVVGSDVSPGHVARAAARWAGEPVRFEVIDALDLTHLPAGAFDLVWCAQCVHHFSPGALAALIAGASRVAPGGVLVIDGRRSGTTLAAITASGLLGAALAGRAAWPMLHDAVVSGLKFYADAELELVARVAAPGARVVVRPLRPGFVILDVRR